MPPISSRTNPKIKELRALRQRKEREESGLFLVEGIRHVGEAVEAGAPLTAIYYAPDHLKSEFARQLVQEQAKSGVPCFELTAEVFDSVAEKDNPQGILAVVQQQRSRLEELTPENFPWGVALVAPQDPGNVGTILRTLDAVGASGLLLLDSSVDPYHPSAIRASMGAHFWRPFLSASFSQFLTWARSSGYALIGTSAHGAQDYRQIPSYPQPRILLMGSEREGLTEPQRAACDLLVGLPMLGRATSLNLAVATGVLLYAMLAGDTPGPSLSHH